MHHYGGKEIAASFRTVRNNTIKVAEDIPEGKYAFRPVESTRTVGELLAHIALSTRFNEVVNLEEKRTNMEGFNFMEFMQPLMAEQAKPRTKAELITLLQESGEHFAKKVEAVSDDFLEERIEFPAGAHPSSRSRFDLLIGSKEHEMHHRGQLMLIMRLLGMVPPVTRAQQDRMAAMAAAQAK